MSVKTIFTYALVFTNCENYMLADSFCIAFWKILRQEKQRKRMYMHPKILVIWKFHATGRAISPKTKI